MRLVNVGQGWSIFIVTPSIEGWPTKAKEAPSPQRGKTDPAGHQPSILMSWET